MSRSASESSESSSTRNEQKLFSRLGGIPVVKSALSEASTTYNKAKEANAMAKLSLSFVELSIKAALKTTKFAYNVVPKPGFVETLTDEVEKKVCQADSLACKGLDVLQETFPYIMTDTTEILSDGAETLEKSEMLEAALIVSEAAIDYINPAIPSIIEVGGNTKLSTVSNKKVDRMIDVSRRTGMALYKGGSKAFMGVASAPWNVTKAGYNMFAGAVKMTGDVMSAFIPPRQKLRRSTRRHVQTKAEDFTFPVSPGKKRKRSNGNSDTDNGKLYELLYVEQPYESGEDPDYCPEATSDTSNDSESSDTVGASDEERDSGEGDEADTSTIGGESLTPEQISKALKSKRGQVVHGQQVTADIKESNESREVHVGDKVNGEEAVGGEEAQATVTTKAEKLKVEKSKFQSDVKTNIKPPAKAKSVTRAAGKDNTPASSHSGKSNSTSTGSPGKSQVDMATNSKRVAERIKEKSPSKKDGKNGMGAASTSKMDDVTKGRIVL